jgi:epoxyqueuosine reductase
MDWFDRSLSLREDPAALVPGTVRVISVTLPYAPDNGTPPDSVLGNPEQAYVSRYALGRDYHKALRQRLARLARQLAAAAGTSPGRVFCDSAPVMEVELARQAGLGWRGKHTLLLNRSAGSWFFLGEVFTDLALPVDAAVEEHCGRCTACIDACPTGAIVAPFQVDARRCISYLTIEHPGSIPVPLRPLIGNRIYGCDDCQLRCPWNREGPRTAVPAEFAARAGLDRASLVELFAWSELEFEQRLAGSAIRRIGHARWLRNLAVALGNGPASAAARQALAARRAHPEALVREHVAWALARLDDRASRADNPAVD